HRAFDGTSQEGSTLPIVYAEFGVQSQLPAAKQSLYTGAEPQTTHPVSEEQQARFYAEAMHLTACQPTVRAFLVFRLIDSVELPDWQSGIYYADGDPKTSRAAVAAAADRAREAPVGCGRLLAPKPLVSFFPVRPPTKRFPTIKPLLLVCNLDCRYEVRLLRLRDDSLVTRTVGEATAGIETHVAFPPGPYPRGSYRLTIRVS